MKTSITKKTIDDLSERISVVYFETERNTRGDIVKTEEVTRCTVWAQVKPLTGKISDSAPVRNKAATYRITAPVRNNEVTYRITIRYRQDILPDDEILWRGRRLKITTPPFD